MKKVWRLLMVVMFVGILCACSRNDEAEKEKYRLQGEENALAYIQEKYQIQAKVKKVYPLYSYIDFLPIPNIFRELSGEVRVIMEYGDKEFKVIISGSECTTDGQDNYQRDDVIEAYCHKLESVIGEPVYLHTLDFQMSGEGERNMFGKNKIFQNSLENFFENVYVYGLFYTNNANSVKKAEEVFLVNNYTNVAIMNFHNEEALTSFAENTKLWKSSDGLNSYSNLQMEYAMDLKDSCVSSDSIISYTTYQPEQIQDSLCFSFDKKRQQVPSDLLIEYTDDKSLYAEIEEQYTPLVYGDILHLKTNLDTILYMPEESFLHSLEETEEKSSVDMFFYYKLKNGKTSVQRSISEPYSPKIDSCYLTKKNISVPYKKIYIRYDDVYLCYIEYLLK